MNLPSMSPLVARHCCEVGRDKYGLRTWPRLEGENERFRRLSRKASGEKNIWLRRGTGLRVNHVEEGKVGKPKDGQEEIRRRSATKGALSRMKK